MGCLFKLLMPVFHPEIGNFVLMRLIHGLKIDNVRRYKIKFIILPIIKIIL